MTLEETDAEEYARQTHGMVLSTRTDGDTVRSYNYHVIQALEYLKNLKDIYTDGESIILALESLGLAQDRQEMNRMLDFKKQQRSEGEA